MDINILWMVPVFWLGVWSYHYEHIIKPERKRKQKALEIAITNTIDNPLEDTEAG